MKKTKVKETVFKMNELNKRIFTNRRLSNLRQEDVAEKLNIKCSTYSQMEREGLVNADRLFKLAEIFNIKPCELYYGYEFCRHEIPDIVTESLHGEEQPVLREPIVTPTPIEPVFSKQEESVISILRHLPKQKRDEAINFITELYFAKKNKN